MAHMTDSELAVLKARAHAAMISGAHLAHAESHIMALVDELLALRSGDKKNALKEVVKPASAVVLEELKAANVEVKTATTVEELAEQLSNDLAGKKDAHDLVVDKVEAETAKREEPKVEEKAAEKPKAEAKGSKGKK